MADAVIVFQNRYPGTFRNCFDQTFAAARDDEVDIFILLEQFSYRTAVGGVDDLDGIFRQTGFARAFTQGRAAVYVVLTIGI